jgi:hypothetical protein
VKQSSGRAAAVLGGIALSDQTVDRPNPGMTMKITLSKNHEAGKVGWILLWLLGIPRPILLILFLLRGCT